jgi:hypothetical protein
MKCARFTEVVSLTRSDPRKTCTWPSVKPHWPSGCSKRKSRTGIRVLAVKSGSSSSITKLPLVGASPVVAVNVTSKFRTAARAARPVIVTSRTTANINRRYVICPRLPLLPALREAHSCVVATLAPWVERCQAWELTSRGLRGRTSRSTMVLHRIRDACPLSDTRNPRTVSAASCNAAWVGSGTYTMFTGSPSPNANGWVVFRSPPAEISCT